MFRIFVEPPELLRKGQFVKFRGDFTDYIRNGQIVEVINAVEVNYRTGYIIPPNDKVRVLLDNSNEGLKLYPTDVDVFYEILMGFRADGDFMIYPQHPAGHYIWRLDEPTMYPDPDAPEGSLNKYLGGFKPEDSPIDAKKIRTYTMKDLEPVVLEVVNHGSEYGKLIIDFDINKCKFTKLSAKDLAGIEVYFFREILHPELMEW